MIASPDRALRTSAPKAAASLAGSPPTHDARVLEICSISRSTLRLGPHSADLVVPPAPGGFQHRPPPEADDPRPLALRRRHHRSPEIAAPQQVVGHERN